MTSVTELATSIKSSLFFWPALMTCLFLLNTTASASPDSSGVRPVVTRIAEKLQKENEVHFGYPVGFAGKPERNKYYRAYKRLKAKATTSELEQLTKNSSPVIVVYAFEALHARNYEGLKTIFLEHVNDTAWFWTAGGCTGFLDRVNWYMLGLLKPEENKKTKLSKTEYDMYCNQFKQQDALFNCD